MPTVDFIIRFEQGETSPEEMVEGFAELIRSGLAWSLQGFYGRTARDLIEAGVISSEGEIDWATFDERMEATL